MLPPMPAFSSLPCRTYIPRYCDHILSDEPPYHTWTLACCSPDSYTGVVCSHNFAHVPTSNNIHVDDEVLFISSQINYELNLASKVTSFYMVAVEFNNLAL